jgi:hypothetical protein
MNKVTAIRGSQKGPHVGPFFVWMAFVVEPGSIGYITGMVSKAQRIVLVDHARLPWRFFGRLTAVQAGL